MRAIGAFGLLVTAQAASAQTVVNGGFETGGLAPWTAEVSSVCNFNPFCEEGEAAVVSAATAGFPMPEGDKGLALSTGNEAGIGQHSFAAAESAGFLVTWTALTWRQRAENAELSLEVTLLDTTGAEVGSSTPDAHTGSFAEQEIETAGGCGRTLTVRVSAGPTANGWGEPFTGVAVFDDFEQGGEPCRMFRDDDGDGYCENGIDGDGDGNCASAGEPTLDEQDCDDTNGNIHPGATDIGGNGIDENCDGTDATATGPGTGGGAGTGAGTGGGAGTGAGTGTSTGTMPYQIDTAGEGPDTIKAGGAGCACSSTGAPAGWLAIGLGGLLVRRRREA